MLRFEIFIWKPVPFLRVLLPFIAGILLQFYFDPNREIIGFVVVFALILISVFNLLNTHSMFSHQWLMGLGIQLFFISAGAVSVFLNQRKISLQNYRSDSYVIATVQEPLTEKEKSFKTSAKIETVINEKKQTANGTVLLYFKKDELKPLLHYGSRIIIHKPLQAIINSGNPGAFDYKQYCAFQDIYYQVYLMRKDYQILSSENKSFFNDFLLRTRIKLLAALRQYITTPDALSIAEALLIGYRDDLDKELVQAYSNTGVVHVIAISGLHIAMIYGLIIFFIKPFQNKRFVKWIKPFVVLTIIWGFTFIAGAAPSILRSAVMFSFIVLGESFSKRINIYNNLAASAFAILLFSPFSLWDVGFQLSYAAVLSIVIFSKHINNWFYFSNKLLKYIWELTAVTLSAQILTLPLIVFYFHQFPRLFLFANLIAVPLSGLILYAELLLLMVSRFTSIAVNVGKTINFIITWMNDFILHINAVPQATWQSLQISISQTVILYFAIAGLTFWLLRKRSKAFLMGLGSLLLFSIIRGFDFITKQEQKKMIVYNVPQHKAMDIIEGRKYQFIGDSILLQDGFLQNFHLKPSRILNRISKVDQLSSINHQHELITSSNKKVMLIDSYINPSIVDKRIKVDAIIISKNPKLNINQLAQAFDCDEYVFDASNPLWKINQWKKDCENLHLRHHSIPEQGAFVMEL